MKKIISITCAGAMMLTMTACGSTGSKAGNGSPFEIVNGKLAGEIRVTAYDSMIYKEFLETQAQAFMAANPGTTVNIEIVGEKPEIKTSESGENATAEIQQMDDSQARSDYINRMSTELMGGRGPDLMAMDVLPWTKYAEGGQLENLLPYMEADAALIPGDYKSSLWDALKFKGGQYLISLDYDFQYMAYDSSLFNEEERQALDSISAPAYETLLEFAKPAYDRNAAANKDKASKIIGYSAQDLLNEIFKEDYSDYLDIENRKGNFNDGKFKALLETVKDYGDKGYLKSDTGEGKSSEEQRRFFFKSNTQFAMLLNAVSSPGRRIMVAAGGDLGVTVDDKVMGPVFSKGGKAGFTYSQAYGLNVNSGNKALAWAFLIHLLCEKAQSSAQLSATGLPIHNGARAKKADQAASQYIPEGPTDEQKQKLAAYMSDVERFSDMLNYYAIPDETINGIVKDETASFMKGERSAEEAASAIQSKVELYLNE